MSRRKYTTLSRQDIKTLKNASSTEIKGTLVILSGILAFCGGNTFVIFLSVWLYSKANLRGEYAFGLAIFLMLGLSVTIFISVIWISRSIIIKNKKEIERKYKELQIANIDMMTGIEFEHYLQVLLSHRGYSVRVTKASGDLGVDLIATGNNDKFAIQAKRYDSKVSRSAISDAVAGMRPYGCNRAMVITNNYFTPDAVKLAQSTGCILIDRDTLANWIIEFQTQPQQNSQA